jgi:hypothetical protein
MVMIKTEVKIPKEIRQILTARQVKVGKRKYAKGKKSVVGK